MIMKGIILIGCIIIFLPIIVGVTEEIINLFKDN